MLGRRRGRDRMSDVKRLHDGNAFGCALFPVVDQTLRGQMLVVQTVQSPVSRLLPNKALDLLFEQRLLVGGKGFQTIAYRVQKKLLAHGKTHRQGVHESGAEGVAAVPSQRERGFQVDQQLANHKLAHETFILGAIDKGL